MAFKVADLDGDGILDKEELKAFQKLADADGDGEITMEEVEHYGERLLKATLAPYRSCGGSLLACSRPQIPTGMA